VAEESRSALLCLAVCRLRFVPVEFPEDDLGAVLAFANVAAECLRLAIGKPVLRAVACERQQKHVDPAIGFLANEIRRRERTPRLAPRHLSLFQLREDALGNNVIDGRTRFDRLDSRGYGRTDGMTYNCGSHVAPPVCNSVRACRLLEQSTGPFYLCVYFW